MPKVLVFSIRLHEGRYHGTGDWPPSPARLFQALIAAAGIRGPISSNDASAIQWLECLNPPIIAAPRSSKGQAVENFVPNNDLDSKGGDPRNIGAIRTKKTFHPRLFDQTTPFHYGWQLPDDAEALKWAHELSRLADGVYQFGRGVDFAWATAELLEEVDFEKVLKEHPGTIHRPTPRGQNGVVLLCPAQYSFSSLETRYAANESRFETVKSGRSISQSFRQQPKPRFRPVAYDSPPSRSIFELHDLKAPENFSPWPLNRAYTLTTSIRDEAVRRLSNALPSQTQTIERCLIGRRPDGSNSGSVEERIRLIPLPSIGHEHSDHNIRRLLVQIPTGCLIRIDDIQWAFSGLHFAASATETVLISSSEAEMANRYLRKNGANCWRSITPVALSEAISAKRTADNDPGNRTNKRLQAANAVHNALRHEGIKTPIEAIRIQKEPFTSKGERAESFAEGSRFSPHRLWHLELTFEEPCFGPIVIGDGRFCGLGIMAPANY